MRALAIALAVLAWGCAPAGQDPPLSDPSRAPQNQMTPGKSLADARADAGKALQSTPPPGEAGDVGRAPGIVRFGQPMDERTAQEALPKSTDPQWSLLATTVIGEDLERGRFTARHPAPVRALAGKDIAISGYMMPLETTPTVRRFLLTRYTPVCQFCPPGAPNEVIEVNSTTPLAPTQALVRVRGRFALTDNGEQGLFFRLDGADTQPAS
jgi:uncharacterized protein